MILNEIFEPPFSKFPQDGSLPILSKSIVKSKISTKFHSIFDKENNKVPESTSEIKPTNEMVVVVKKERKESEKKGAKIADMKINEYNEVLKQLQLELKVTYYSPNSKETTLFRN